MTALTGGDRILGGRYRVGSSLGRGAMAEVYDGVDTRLERPVAIKVLRDDSLLGPEGRVRFAREARAAARLSHPHSVAVYDTGTDGDVAYIVMERLPGTTMADYMQAGPLPADWVLCIAADVLDALAAAHAAGLTHRDIKPGNILVTPDDRAKVADFGIAKLTDMDVDLTATGLVVGTAAYLPPERIAGQPASARGDLYALGVVIYEALAGRKPFTGSSPLAVAYAAGHSDPPDLGRLRPDLPPALVAAVARAMAAEPLERFATAAEMAGALRASAAQVEPPAVIEDPNHLGAPTAELPAGLPVASPERRRRRRPVLLVAVALLVAAGAVAVLVTRHSPTRTAARAPSTTGPGSTVAPASNASARTAPAGTVSPSTVSPSTVSPSTVVPSTVVPSTVVPSTAAAAAPDPQAAALESAAATLAGSGGAGSQAADILQRVAALPAGLRPGAAAEALSAVRSLYSAGGLDRQQYQQAAAPLEAIANAGGDPDGNDGGHHGHGGHGGG